MRATGDSGMQASSNPRRVGLGDGMGGGGLDYYDPSLLVRLSGDVPPPTEEQVRPLREKAEAARKAWDAIRGTPEGLSKGADGMLRLQTLRARTVWIGFSISAARALDSLEGEQPRCVLP